MLVRILASITLLLSILFLPLWTSILIALAGMIYFSVYSESVLLFILSDLLYGVKEVQFSLSVFVISFIVLVALIIIEILKNKIKFYK